MYFHSIIAANSSTTKFRATVRVNGKLFSALLHAQNIQVCLNKLLHLLEP